MPESVQWDQVMRDCGSRKKYFSLFFLPLHCCVLGMCKALSWKLADSNLEKLYLAGFLRHGF